MDDKDNEWKGRGAFFRDTLLENSEVDDKGKGVEGKRSFFQGYTVGIQKWMIKVRIYEPFFIKDTILNYMKK